MTDTSKKRLKYAVAAAVILAVEVVIALFVRDRFIRPYVGDMLVTLLLCFIVRIVMPNGHRFTLPIGVFAFSALVEIGQYFDYDALLGLDGIPFFAVLLGSTFSLADIVCYAFGCLAAFALDGIFK